MTPCESCREKDKVIKRLKSGWCATCYPRRLEYEAQLAAQAETIKAMREALDYLLSGNRIPFHWKDSPGGYFCAWCDAPWQRGHYESCEMGCAIDRALALPSKPSPEPEAARLKDAVVEAARVLSNGECPRAKGEGGAHDEKVHALREALAALDAAEGRQP